MDRHALERLGHHIVSRRVALGFRNRTDLAGSLQFTVRTLADIEHGVRKASPGTYAMLENKLAWAPGSIDTILADGEPTEPVPTAAPHQPQRPVPGIRPAPNPPQRPLPRLHRGIAAGATTAHYRPPHQTPRNLGRLGRPEPARRLARAGDMSARIISTVGRAIDVIVAGRLVSHLRFAAGVCVLAAGLLMASAGGAVAVADPDSSGSAAPGDGGTNASGQGGTTARSPVGDVTGTLRETIQRVTSTLGSGRQPGQQPFHRREKPGGRAWRHGYHGREVGPGPRRAVPNVVAPVPDAVAPVPDGRRRFPMRRPAGSRCGRRRFPIWSGRFLTSSRRFRTCSHRLPVRSSR